MLASDDDILGQAEAGTKQGKGGALATVIETWGSAPFRVAASRATWSPRRST